MDNVIKIAEYIRKGYLGYLIIAILLVLLVYLVINPDKAFKWKAAIQRLFIKFFKSARKGVIANGIRGDIIRSTKKLGIQEIVPGDMKIEWVKEETPSCFFEGNQIIVRMSNQNHPQKNLVTAVCAYINNGSLTKARRYLPLKMSNACDYTLIRKILLNTDINALNYYDDYVYSIGELRDNELLGLIEELRFIDNRGMFTHVFLNELNKLVTAIFPSPPNAEIVQNLKILLKFLIDAQRNNGRGDNSDLKLRKGPFRINIAFTANDETLLSRGEEYYVQKIISAFEIGRCETEYFSAIGRKIEVAKSIAKKAKQKLKSICVIPKEYDHVFDDGMKRNAICIEISRIRE